MGYGADEIYTQWSQRSLVQWKELFAATGHDALFQKTGVLWLAEPGNPHIRAAHEILRRNCVPFQEFQRDALLARYPQINLDGIATGIYESESGVLMGRRAVAAVVAAALRHGVEFKLAAIAEPNGNGTVEFIESTSGEKFFANQFVFACGAWLAKLFPTYLGNRIFSTRQAVEILRLFQRRNRWNETAPVDCRSFLRKSRTENDDRMRQRRAQRGCFFEVGDAE